MSSITIQEAEARFAEVIGRARREGPQVITSEGKETAVVVSAEDFQKLTTGSKATVHAWLATPEGKFDWDIPIERHRGRRRIAPAD